MVSSLYQGTRDILLPAKTHARARTPLIGGFHSLLERSVLEVMLAARAPVVTVIARKLNVTGLPVAWREAVRAGIVAVVSVGGYAATINCRAGHTTQPLNRSPRRAHRGGGGSTRWEFGNLHYHEDWLFTDVNLFNDKLLDYLVWFNTEHPHYGLGLLSPYEFLKLNHQCNMDRLKTKCCVSN